MNEKKEDISINFDINFDSISEINKNNASFYSVDHDLKDKEKQQNHEFDKSKIERKIDMEAVKLLPYYIEKVSQNIKFIDSIINKKSWSSQGLKDPTTSVSTSNISSNSEKIITKIIDSSDLLSDDKSPKKNTKISSNLNESNTIT